MSTPKPAPAPRQWAYRALVATAPIARARMGAALWERAWDAAVASATGTTTVRLHGVDVAVNVGHPYPAFARRWPSYNAPLVELVHQTARARGRAVTLVDVGASIGDTVLLVRERCGSELGTAWCIEGDEAFGALLDANLGADPSVHIVHAMAAERTEAVPALVRVHAGTASPRGDELVSAAPLDDLVEESAIDVLKVDTDGFDGRVLAGASRLLATHPVVLFEWHPMLADAADFSLELAFEILADAGYERFLWFDKYGRYVRTESVHAVADRRARAEQCRRGDTPGPDWHYDVVAVSPDRRLDESALSELRFARGLAA